MSNDLTASEQKKLQALKERLLEVDDLDSAGALLTRDQMTHMPPGGAAARGRQLATLRRLSHDRFTDPAMGRLLDELRPVEERLPFESDEASLIRITRRGYERATRIPAAFVAELERHQARSYAAWTKARPANDFAAVLPFLEETLALSRRLAGYFPGYDHIADPLIDFADYGLEASQVQAIFSELREGTVPLVNTIASQPSADDACLRQHYPVEGQTAFFTRVIKDFGYDYDRGRCDVSPHPFTIKVSLGDVRITVRYDEHNLGEAVFSAFHEAGHAIYEQGINPTYEGTPLAGGTSSSVHESQSRLWENLVGRSWGFWSHTYPKLQAVFPDQLAEVSLETFYRAVNKVERSLIRTDADEVTYNLHVMLRFDLELALLEGNLAVKDLPEAWGERFEADLGITPPDHRDGVLQDVHWYSGLIGGGFQGYTLGNILCAQFYQAALKAHPEIPAEIEGGRFDTLHNWLRDNIYQYGGKFTTNELVERVTGGPLQVGPYLDYLRAKYGRLYRL
jgi:carboxypeptidase Taq